jgi:hypothetical protein
VRIDDLDPPPQPNGDVPEIRMTHDYEYIRGKVVLGDAAIGGMTIIFRNSMGVLFTFPVDASGTFEGKLPPGEYTVSVSDPHYGVTEIEPLGQGDYYVFIRERENQPPQPTSGADLLAFIHDVSLADNRIANMGFSGIGAPRFTTADAAALREFGFAVRGKVNSQLLYLVYVATGTITGFVIDLTISRNTITHCLQNAPLTNVDQFAIERALGGISLALCDGVSIEENIIQNCGRGAEIPVCGVFISFSIDVTIRENHILNNGQDRRAESVIAEFVDTPDVFGGPPPMQPAGTSRRGSINRESDYASKRFTYDRYRVSMASGSFTANVPDIDFGRGPRAAILLPICLSANVFAGGAAQKATASLNTQGLTGGAEGRHAARIDGNYVVQPFGKTLFIGAAGSLSITDNQLISDRALPRDLDALAGGLSGRVAANFVIGPVDLFASNVMVVDICPGSYVVDLFKILGDNLERANGDINIHGLQPTPIPFGFPDGNILFAGNQIKQGDAGARTTMVTVFSMDDVNFVDNQVDVLNAADILATAIVFGATARAANNRMKEPLLLGFLRRAPGTVVGRIGQRFSLVEISIFAGGMTNNQGHYCFKSFVGTNNGVETANIGLLASAMQCDENLIERLPDELLRGLLLLLLISVRFAEGLSKLGE